MDLPAIFKHVRVRWIVIRRVDAFSFWASAGGILIAGFARVSRDGGALERREARKLGPESVF